MNEFTYAHLDAWIEKQFPETYDDDTRYRALIDRMSGQYMSDPTLYDRNGWWFCYNDCGAIELR